MPSSLFSLSSTSILFFFFLITLTCSNVNKLYVVDASSFNEPHSHRGVVTPFQPGDPNVPLDEKAKEVLSQGRPYQTQVQSGGSGRGLVVQDINAPPSIVWGRILDYDNYVSMVPKTVESKNYNIIHQNELTQSDLDASDEDDAKSLSQIIYTRMKVGFPLLKLEFFIKHKYYPSLNSLTWTLDYDKLSDFNDSCGYWYIIPHPDYPKHKTRVYYSVEVSMFDWVPKFVVDFMSTKALTDATAWVKKFSELEYAKQGGDSSTCSMDENEKDDGISSLTDDTSSSSKKKKKKKGLFGGLFRNKRKEEEERQKQLEEEERQKQLELKRLQEEKEKAKEEMMNAEKILRLTWMRLGLISTVSLLVIYDLHLWISG